MDNQTSLERTQFQEKVQEIYAFLIAVIVIYLLVRLHRNPYGLCRLMEDRVRLFTDLLPAPLSLAADIFMSIYITELARAICWIGRGVQGCVLVMDFGLLHFRNTLVEFAAVSHGLGSGWTRRVILWVVAVLDYLCLGDYPW
jgi:hypothetical protein